MVAKISSWGCTIFGLCAKFSYLLLALLSPLTNFPNDCRFDVEKYVSKGIGVIGWTVNSTADKDHFESALRIPYMTDYVLVNESGD